MVNTYPNFISTDYLSWSDLQPQIENAVYRGDLHLFRRWVGREFSGLWSEVFSGWCCFLMSETDIQIVGLLAMAIQDEKITMRSLDCRFSTRVIQQPKRNACQFWMLLNGVVVMAIGMKRIVVVFQWDTSHFCCSYRKKIFGFSFRMECFIIFCWSPRIMAISLTPI